jgi:XapX domain-containing protein
LMASLFAVSWIGTFQALHDRHSYAWMFFGLTAGLILTDALAVPATVLHFAGTRVAEIVVGACSCLVVACLFDTTGSPAAGTAATDGPVDVPRSDWVQENRRLLIEHSTRTALAVGLLPLVWRWFEIEDFSQTAVTSYVVMIVPAATVRDRRHGPIYERMAHRTVGCLLGSVCAIVSLGVFGTDLLPTLLTSIVAVWVGHHVQNGREGVSYLGAQFVLGFLVTAIQGPSPAASILPGLARLLGILIGCVMLYLLNLVWPPADE